jgi:hypothetical protein
LREVIRRESGLGQLLHTNIFEKLQNNLKLIKFIAVDRANFSAPENIYLVI